MNLHEWRAAQREAYDVYHDLARLHTATQQCLSTESVSAEDVNTFHKLSEAFLEPLGVSLESVDSDDPIVQLQAGLEGLSTTMGKLRKLMSQKAPKDQKEAKSFSKILVELDNTFLDSGWLKEQSLAEEPVTVGKAAANLYREDRPIPQLASAVRVEVATYKKFVQELASLIGPYNKACGALFDKLKKGDSAEQVAGWFHDGVKHLPPTPASAFKEKTYSFIGMQKGDRFVIQHKQGYEFGYYMKPTTVSANETLPALKANEAKTLAEVVVDLAGLYTQVEELSNSLAYQRSWEDLGDGASELEVKEHKTWEHMERTLSEPAVWHVSDIGLNLLMDHFGHLAEGIHRYLKACITK